MKAEWHKVLYNNLFIASPTQMHPVKQNSGEATAHEYRFEWMNEYFISPTWAALSAHNIKHTIGNET